MATSTHLTGMPFSAARKFAYALTILDGRTEMSSDDWRLSGIAAAVSNHVRDWVVSQLAQAQETEAEELGRLRGIGQAAAENEKEAVQGERVQRMLRWALAKLDEAGGRMTNRDLWRAVNSRDRSALHSALTLGVADGLLKQLADRTWVRL